MDPPSQLDAHSAQDRLPHLSSTLAVTLPLAIEHLPSVGEENSVRRSPKKRAFWGWRTHPELVRGLERIEKSSFEVLMHEVVFSTSFDAVSIEADETEERDENEPEDVRQQRR